MKRTVLLLCGLTAIGSAVYLALPACHADVPRHRAATVPIAAVRFDLPAAATSQPADYATLAQANPLPTVGVDWSQAAGITDAAADGTGPQPTIPAASLASLAVEMGQPYLAAVQSTIASAVDQSRLTAAQISEKLTARTADQKQTAESEEDSTAQREEAGPNFEAQVEPPAKSATATKSAGAEDDVSAKAAAAKPTEKVGEADDAKQPAPAAPIAAAKPTLSPELQELDEKIHKVLAIYREHNLDTGKRSPWEIMHGLIGFGASTEIRRDGPGGEKVNAIGWLLMGGHCNVGPLTILSNGRPFVQVGPGFQGHPGQFLGMLAQSHVRADSPFQLGGRSFTVADIIEDEKLGCHTNMELTFDLIAMSYYLKGDETWKNSEGEEWSIARLLHEELRQPIHTAACGGTHRLFGISSSYLMRAKQGLPIDGDFLKAQTYIRDYQRYTLGSLQNSDGSFSTDWFKRPADSGDIARKLQTTGHMTEWLAFSLPDEQIEDPREVKAVDFLATLLLSDPNRDWSIGPLGHALHALAIYDLRLNNPTASPAQVAREPKIVGRKGNAAVPSPAAAQRPAAPRRAALPWQGAAESDSWEAPQTFPQPADPRVQQDGSWRQSSQAQSVWPLQRLFR